MQKKKDKEIIELKPLRVSEALSPKQFKELQEEKQKSRPMSEVLKEMKEYRKKRYSGILGKFLSWWDRIWFDMKHFNIFKEIKYFIQRGRRGWSDRDVWGTYDYIARVVSEMTKHLAKPVSKGYCCSYPGNLKSRKEWQVILNKISNAFKLMAEKEPYSLSLWKKHPSLAKQCDIQTHDDYRKVKEGMKLFEKWFRHLWD